MRQGEDQLISMKFTGMGLDGGLKITLMKQQIKDTSMESLCQIKNAINYDQSKIADLTELYYSCDCYDITEEI